MRNLCPVVVVLVMACLAWSAAPLRGQAAGGGERAPGGGGAESGRVLVGLDVLKRDGYAPLRGKRVAIVTNHTGLDADGNHLVHLLHASPAVNVVKLFSPEHGLYGTADHNVDHSVDPETGLRVYSLYGPTRRPTPDMLAEVDTIVFDIQDVGARYYTYISTMGYVMEEAAKKDIEVVVLDRPNPITGNYVAGPIADERHRGFTAYGPIPVAHGMTVGELAQLFNREYDINVRLTVVPMEGWTRDMWWDETGVRWVNPSPNLRSPTQALLYLPIGLLEASNVSVGRGTDTPFEWFGAPWIDPEQFARELTAMNLPGLRFEPVTFTPRNTHHKLNDTEVHGVRVVVTDRDAVDGVLTGVVFAHTLERLYPERYMDELFVKMLQNQEAADRVFELSDPREANAIWQEELEAFKRTREQYLLYR